MWGAWSYGSCPWASSLAGNINVLYNIDGIDHGRKSTTSKSFAFGQKKTSSSNIIKGIKKATGKNFSYATKYEREG